jgi:hypothetical protein
MYSYNEERRDFRFSSWFQLYVTEIEEGREQSVHLDEPVPCLSRTALLEFITM